MIKLKYKGYTLVELLAVVVIIGILALVAVPSFSKYILKGGEMYYQNLEKSVENAGREFMNENPHYLPSDPGKYTVLSKGDIINTGIIEKVVDKDEKECKSISVYVGKNNKGRYSYKACLECGNYKTKSNVCTNGIQNILTQDITEPDIVEFDEKSIVVTTNSVTVNAKCYDKDTDIIKYEFSTNGGASFVDNGKNSSYKIFGSVNNSYSFQVRCTNKVGLSKKSGIKIVKILDFDKPNVSYKNSGDINNYKPSKDIIVTYDTSKIETPYRYIKSTVSDIIVDKNIYSCSSESDLACSNSAVRIMKKNVWYKVYDNSVTITFNKEGTIYAKLSDSINVKSSDPVSISKINGDQPTIKARENPVQIEKEGTYYFKDNVDASFGNLEGTVSCDPVSANKEGIYNVTCTATSNNGLTATATYTAIWSKYTCKDDIKYCVWTRPSVTTSSNTYYDKSDNVISTSDYDSNFGANNVSKIFDDSEETYWYSRKLSGTYCTSTSSYVREEVLLNFTTPIYARGIALKMAGSDSGKKVSATIEFYSNNFLNCSRDLLDRPLIKLDNGSLTGNTREEYKKEYKFCDASMMLNTASWYVVPSDNDELQKIDSVLINVYKTGPSSTTNRLKIYDIKVLQ